MRFQALLIALMSIATPAVAQQLPCAPLDRVEADLAKDFHETRVAQGVVEGGESMVVIYASPNGETWTVAIVRALDQVACLVSAGQNWQTRNDAPAVPEQGS